MNNPNLKDQFTPIGIISIVIGLVSIIIAVIFFIIADNRSENQALRNRIDHIILHNGSYTIDGEEITTQE